MTDPHLAAPLSWTQERIWFEEQLRPGDTAYHMPVILRVRGPLDVAALQAAVDALVARHDALRTVFEAADGEPRQRVPAAVTVPVRIQDVRGLADPEAAAHAALHRAVREPFDLGHGPLLRVVAVRYGDDAHLLLLSAHHLIADGQSFAVLFAELPLLYADPGAALKPLRRGFAEAVRAERERLGEAGADELVAWWREHLDGVPRVLELPADRPRPAVRGHRGARVRSELDASAGAAVRELARAHEATPFMTLLTAFGVVLARQSGQERMLVGTPASTRGPGDRELVGCFLNTLPLKVDAAGDPAFAELLGRVRDDALEAFARQRVPLGRLVADLAPERDLSRGRLVQVFFNMLPPVGAPVLPGCTVEQLPFGDIDNKFDLTLYAGARPDGGYTLEAVFDAGLFDAGRIEDLLGQFRAVLSQAAAEPARTVRDFDLATARSATLLPDLGADLAPAAPEPLADRLAKHAATTPDAPALIAGDRVWSYAEIERTTDRLARLLHERGIRPGDVLALHAARHPAVVLGILAAVKAGAVFAVLDADHPDDALRARAEALAPRAWISCAPGLPLPRFVTGPVLRIEPGETLDRALSGLPHGAPAAVPGPDADAYVAFTSGSTGRPRRVVGTHRPLTHFLDWYTRAFELGPGDRFAVLSGLGHDPFLRDVLAPLWAGGAAVFPAADVRDTAALAHWLGTAAPTVAHLTPALARALADQADGTAGWPALRLVGFGGDTLTGRTLRAWARLAPGADLLNLYGATETPQAVSTHLAHRAGTPADTIPAGPVPLGPGIEGVQLLVLAGDRPAGLGEIGELVVRTPYLARYGDEGDASGFVPDPFPGRTGERVYRTGDLARLRPDGLLDHLGRADRQAKVRGHRVEPAEAEAALDALPGIRQSAVLALPDGDGDHRLVAFLVPRLATATGGAAPDLTEVRGSLARRLPGHLVPSAYVVLDSLPLTANRKTDLDALRALEHRAEAATGGFVAPHGPVQERLAEQWRVLLRRERVGATDDFFALGGHSLLLTRLLARVRREFPGAAAERLTLQDLFAHPTVAALAALLDEQDDTGTAPYGDIPRTDPGEPAPLSWTQERLWLEEQLRPGDAAYNMPVVLRLRGPLESAALQRAVDTVVERHAVLRTVFEAGPGGTPRQRAVPGARVVVRTTDLSDRPDPDAAAVAAAMDSVREPFDLTRGPLLRVALLRIGDGDHVLALTVHHIGFDGWSFGVLLRELSAAYQGDELPEPALQFADVARWERADLDGPVLDGLVDWWRGHLDGAPRVLELPTDRPRPAVSAHRGARRRITVDAATSAALRELSRAHGSTLFTTLLSAYAVVLSRWSGQERLLVGTPVANRPRAEFEDLPGCFLNTLPLRVDLDGDPAFGELVGRVRDSALEALAHQRVPFGRLVSELVPERDLSRGPLVQVLFALQNVELGTLDVPGLSGELVEVSAANSQFDLNLRMIDTGRELIGWLDHDVELFDTATVERFAEHFTNVLTAVAADPSVLLSGIDPLGSDERARLLYAWNDTAVDWPAGDTLTGLLAEAAARHGDAVAVRFADRELTYAELHGRANALAHRLRSLGVGPDTVVGVHLDRSPELMVALLAVLKAGGAYLPLDTGYPRERLAFMLADARVPVLLARSGGGEALAADGIAVVAVDDRAGDGFPGTEPEPVAGPDHLAYVIYTSGSTGRPKGVQVPHRGIVNRLRWMQDAYRLTGADTVLQKTPISFDVSVWELFWPLLTGARLVLAAPGGHRDPDHLAGLVRDERVTVCHFVPPMLDAFLAAGRAADCGSLRLVVCSGEALPADLARRFHLALPQAALENLYGPTEASVDVTRWTSRPDWTGAAVPIGTPIANTRTYVLDALLRPAPIGVPGELYLGGVQLARGYGGRPELTADRFVPDPYADEAGARLYRTGDLARRHADGYVEYLGRTDHQVKVRGFRIELGEIEAALLDLDAVGQAVVLVREDRPGDRRIVAYLTERQEVSVGALRSALAERLPEHMVPSAFVVLDTLPLSPNGKVDRGALPAPDRDAGTAGEHIAPATPQEELLAGLWQRVLGLDRVGTRDNFFEIGGDSMHAVRIVGLAREAGHEIPLQRLFAAQTVEDLARWLAENSESAATSGAGSARQEIAAFGLLSPEDLARLTSR
ncbi:amino acid adenylation domain-containing protein [Streptomyces cyaneochromogenes]|uniref:Amino acid adenylation domain-containing protein n=1 Tax=Streptomyces cyaneochromogenes TaxID=2496836 RepID=A0A3S9MAY6_9ACTN|nr:non-ribosomal peptide synthetase [Streptomyces cyaneochromogenes]AZQ36253.1 amino acid adenylation domain-containing protein [Streptomyces cyaneochromogenes]